MSLFVQLTTDSNRIDHFVLKGVVANTFLFYGFYNTLRTANGAATYYMGYAFLSVGLINLIFSALSMIGRLGAGLKNSIVKKNENSRLSEKVFCVWDFHLSSDSYAKSKKENVYRSIQVCGLCCWTWAIVELSTALVLSRTCMI
jgi:hypothetical protein